MESQLPSLEPGLTYLDDDDAQTALYRVVGSELAEATDAYWVDARNAAVPDAIRQQTPGRAERSLSVARAFTGYQHYELVRSLPGEISRDTGLVVAPNLGSLYADDDIPEYEARRMFAATLELLTELAEAVNVPVLVTTTAYRDRVRSAADRTFEADRTQAGLRVSGPSFQPDVYWQDWGFQTTIPYWVDLLGIAGHETESPVTDGFVGV